MEETTRLALTADGDLETAAARVQKVDDIKYAINELPSSRALDFLAWLLVYKVVNPLVVLEAMIYSNNFDAVRICGTREFESDVLSHLKLSPTKGVERSVTSRDPRIQVDILPTPRPKADERTRKILQSSMSASEVAHKLQQAKAHGSETSTMFTILQACLEHKLYNRYFGNIVVQLAPIGWSSAFVETTADFLREVDLIHEVYKLQVAGQFIGHVLSARCVPWERVFPLLDIDAGSNARIVILALLKELRTSLGQRAAAEVRALPGTEGLTKSEMADDFWELAGYKI